MKRLVPVSGDGESGEFRELFAEIRLFLEVKQVPAVFLALAHCPSLLRGFWSLMRTAWETESSHIRRTTKEYIALAAMSAAGVETLRDMMLATLKERGVDAGVLSDLVDKGETLRLPERTRKILVFARRAALDPAMLTEEHFDELRRQDLGDKDLVELVGFSAVVTTLIAMTRAFGMATVSTS